jgi:hypothetical protein
MTFKFKVTTDLTKVQSKLRQDGMLDDQTVTQRANTLVHYKDFTKISTQNKMLKSNLSKLKPKVPSHTVSQKLPVTDCRNYLAERANSPLVIDFNRIQSSIPKQQPRLPKRPPREPVKNHRITEGVLNPVGSVPSHKVKPHSAVYRMREAPRPQFDVVMMDHPVPFRNWDTAWP